MLYKIMHFNSAYRYVDAVTNLLPYGRGEGQRLSSGHLTFGSIFAIIGAV